MSERNVNKLNQYALRKTSLGVGSVLIGAFLMGVLLPNKGLAEEMPVDSPVIEEVQAMDEAPVVAEENPASNNSNAEGPELRTVTEPAFAQTEPTSTETSIPAAALNEYRINHALGAQVTASDQENEFPASKATDGIVNRNATNLSQSRWGTNHGTEARQLTVTLEGIKQIEEFGIVWERTNVKGFQIEGSLDGQTYSKLYEKTDDSYVELDTRIKLSSPAQAKYVKLTVNRFDGGTINWPSVSLYEFQVIGKEILTNLAYGKNVTTNANETPQLDASKLVDGDDQSRWSSDRGVNPKFVQIDLGQVQPVRSLVLDWERKNPSRYKIQVSQNQTDWIDAKVITSKPTEFKETITLDQTHQARYLKLLIESFDPNAENRAGKIVNWDTVSLYEVEVYKEAILAEQEISLAQLANSLVIPAIRGDMGTWQLPVVPTGVSIEFIGADLEQIIDRDLRVYQPLVDTNVVVNYRLRRGQETVESPAYTVLVSGKYQREATDNAKPQVAPGLAEWKGQTGQFQPLASSRIVINPKDRQALAFTATSFQEDYRAITGRDIAIVYDTNTQAGDFYFELSQQDPGLKKEGYLLTIGDTVEVVANQAQGAFWSTQTLLQLLNQNPNAIAKGIARDYPKYETRGFVLDVGRKPIQIGVLKDMIKALSWYKFNDFQLHLNDNYIWVEEFQNTDNPYGAYSAFRLESDIKEGGNGGLNRADLTAKDVFYTKQEFKELIEFAQNRGIKIVPEFDAPAHALAFTKVRPDLTMTDHSVRRWVDHLEVSNPKSLEFIKSVWDEYIDGDDPVFAGTDTIHVGVDEFEGNNEAFRNFIDKLLKYAIEKGKTPRFWGSLTQKPGTTPVQVQGTEMNIWSTGWARPADMYQLGYKLINTLDSELYIVPAAGYYADYLNTEHLYNNWEANKMGNTIIPAGSDQMKGGAFAIWNDMIDRRANGILEHDIYSRFEAALPVLPAKMWGNRDGGSYSDYMATVAKIGNPANYNPYNKINSPTDSILHYKFDLANLEDVSGNNLDGLSAVNVTYADGENSRALRFSGGESYMKTPLMKVGPDNSLSFRVKLDPDATGEQILAENSNSALKLVQKDTGKVGYSIEGYHHSFNYTLPKGEWVEVAFKGYVNKAELYINGQLVDTLSKNQTGSKHVTMTLPTEYIGSKTSAIKGLVDDMMISQVQAGVAETYPSKAWTITVDNFNNGEGIDKAFDGNTSTIWHTKWQPSKQDLPATILVDMKESLTFDKLIYLPRQSGTNGNITHYRISAKNTETDDYSLVKEGNLPATGEKKTISFDRQIARYLKIEVLGGSGGFGSAAEFALAQTDYSRPLRNLLVHARAHLELETDYTTESIQQVREKLETSQNLLASENPSLDALDQSYTELAAAINALLVKPVADSSTSGQSQPDVSDTTSPSTSTDNPVSDTKVEEVSQPDVSDTTSPSTSTDNPVSDTKVEEVSQPDVSDTTSPSTPTDNPASDTKVEEVSQPDVSDTTSPSTPTDNPASDTKVEEVAQPTPPTREVRRREVVEELAFSTQTIENKDLVKGDKKLVQKGENGRKIQVIEEILLDGKVIDSRLVETRIEEAKPEIFHIGSKEEIIEEAPLVEIPKVAPSRAELPSLDIQKQTRKEHAILPYERKEIQNPELEKGISNLLQVGKEGSVLKVYEDIYVSGQLVVSRLVSSQLNEAIDEIVAIGVKEQTQETPFLSNLPVEEGVETLVPASATKGNQEIEKEVELLPQKQDKQIPTLTIAPQTKEARRASSVSTSKATLPETGQNLDAFQLIGLTVLASLGLASRKRKKSSIVI
ncbi:TPA: discoidin domain-containing protein [Streptococcus suis]|nr:discoidin domain-containing protein [Streptococcus suis]